MKTLYHLAMTENRIILMHMPDGGEAGRIDLWFQGDKSHVEFRGKPYSQWEHENDGGWFQRVHDAMEGWHSCVLHTDDVLALLPRHEDYWRVLEIVREAEDFSVAQTMPRC